MPTFIGQSVQKWRPLAVMKFNISLSLRYDIVTATKICECALYKLAQGRVAYTVVSVPLTYLYVYTVGPPSSRI